MQALSGNSRVAYTQSVINRIDARTKMMICLLASVVVIILKDVIPLSFLLTASIIYVLLQKRFGVLLVCYGALMVMGLMALFCVKIMTVFMPEMGKFNIWVFFVPFLRVTILINVVLALALSSKIQVILTSLRSLHLPLFIYLPAAVMIRFIPSFINDIRLISQSLKIRGYRINPLTLTFHPFLTTRLLFVPTVIRALRSSDELAVAAELKGVGYSEKVSYYRTNRFTGSDYVAGALAFVLTSVACLLEYTIEFFI